MSKENKNVAAPQEKVMTKYDRKMQKRQEEKIKAEREKKISIAVTTIVVVALVAFILSFPIRTMVTLNKTFVTVGGEAINRVEFDYSYYTTANNYINSYSAYLSYFGLDPSKDLAEQTYMGEMSWKDYFEESTIDSIKRNKALMADAKAAGFTHDSTAEFKRFADLQRTNAKEAGLSLGDYIKQTYGSYATLKRIQPFVEDALFVSAYYDQLSQDKLPGADEIQAKYEESPEDYDSVDYRILQFDAELPTEPTALADKDAQVADGEEYTPSEAEVKKAMADAKKLADNALKTISTEGALMGGMTYSSTSYLIAEWVFDDARKDGDKTVLEDEGSNRYYCVEFVSRYRDETPTADVRILSAENAEKAKEMFNTWKSGAANEDSFTALCEGEYYENAAGKGGLVEGVTIMDDMYPELVDWIFAEGRGAGDCEVVTVEDGTSFVVYFVGDGNPEWYNKIRSSLLSTILSDYVDALSENVTVEDPDKNLKYLEIRAKEEAEAAAALEEEESNGDLYESDAEPEAE